MQIKAGVKKEIIFFAKTFRMYGVLIAMIALAALSPLMLKASEVIFKNLPEIETEINMLAGTEENITITESEFGDNDAILEMQEMISMDFAYISAISGITGNAILVLLLCMLGTAGGEQKKRSIIIPNCSGLKPVNYITSKYIVYPIFAFVSTIVVSILSYFLCKALFGASLDMAVILRYILSASLYMVFLVSLMLFMGITTGKAGLSATIIYVGATIIPSILSLFKINKYNPFALQHYFTGFADLSTKANKLELVLNVLITISLIVLFYILTVVIFNARQINNSKKIGIESV
ncbi:MAG: hypothetical protein GX967_01730 [Clostridiales bacterium]|nr:hypothetical protein [Clostridiales bacterium]